MATFDQRQQVVTTQYNADRIAIYEQAMSRPVDPETLVAAERQFAALPLGSIPDGGETAAIIEVGGLGKTQLASEFLHRYGQFLAGGVLWLSFADPAVVSAEVAACGGPGALALPNRNFTRCP